MKANTTGDLEGVQRMYYLCWLLNESEPSYQSNPAAVMGGITNRESYGTFSIEMENGPVGVA